MDVRDKESSLPYLLLVARNFPPLLGGIESLMKSTVDSLIGKYNVVLVGPEGCSKYADGVKKVFELPSNAAGFLLSAMVIVPGILLRYKPLFVVGSSGLMSPVVAISSLFQPKGVLFFHGLDIVAPSKAYRNIFLRCARVVDRILVNSSNTKQLAISHNLKGDKISILHPCISEIQKMGGSIEFIEKMKSNSPYILYAGRIIPRKGLLEYLENSACWLRESEFSLVVAGDEPFGQVASTEKDYRNRISEVIEKHDLSHKVVFLGRVSNEQLAESFRQCEVHIMPLVEVPGDVEGFGMVAVEAACFGKPTVAFNCGGVGDALSGDSKRVTPADYQGFAAAIEALVRSPADQNALKEWSRRFQLDSFRPKLINELENLI